MVAYIISVPHVLSDPRESGPYYDGVAATMALYGGGSQSLPGLRVTTLEGAWHPAKGGAILEFPSYERPWRGTTRRSTPPCLSCGPRPGAMP